MTVAELKALVDSPERKDSPWAAAVRQLFAQLEDQRLKLIAAADRVVEHETMRIDLKIARGANKAYEAENARLRKLLLDAKEEWPSE